MKVSKELIKGSTSLLVMSVLKGKDLYGYRIIKELEIRSGRKRKYYHLTSKGLKQLDSKKQEWKFYSESVDRVLNFA